MNQTEAVPAATVILMREARKAGLQVLMLHRTSRVAFGGMWAFPGGRIEAADRLPGASPQQTAKRAAARETLEEAGIRAAPEDFVWFSHWTPPPDQPRRFATWFFLARTPQPEQVRVDGGEIQAHAWIQPREALARQAAGEIDLAPPTWMTLNRLSGFADVEEALRTTREKQPDIHETRLVRRPDGVRVAVWQDDAAYGDGDLAAPGARHRLVLQEGGYLLEHSA